MSLISEKARLVVKKDMTEYLMIFMDELSAGVLQLAS